MTPTYVAFADLTCVARGNLLEVALQLKARYQQSPCAPATIFEDKTSRVVDVWLEGTDQQIKDWILAHLPEALPAEHNRPRGRPKLGVVGREVTLLPRQWDWLHQQPGGASVTLRKLIDQAAKDPQTEQRRAQDATYRFCTAVAGNAVGFEEALRALYAGQQNLFTSLIQRWPSDVAEHANMLARPIWQSLPNT